MEIDRRKMSEKKPTSFAAKILAILMFSGIVVVVGTYAGLLARIVWEGFSWGWGLFGL